MGFKRGIYIVEPLQKPVIPSFFRIFFERVNIPVIGCLLKSLSNTSFVLRTSKGCKPKARPNPILNATRGSFFCFFIFFNILLFVVWIEVF